MADTDDSSMPLPLRRAVELARISAETGGGPFGAVITDKEGNIVAEGNNLVTKTCDPTAHAEICAIRNAGKKLESNVLSGLTLYTSTEPCPMCLTASYWARLDAIVYASDRHDAAEAGFDDAWLYDEVATPHEDRKVPISRPEGAKELGSTAFKAWKDNADRIHY